MTSIEEKTSSIWFDIDQLHLKYLQHEDNVQKIELRKLLEKKAKEYLCLVTQQRKFVSPYTGDIISNSIRWINNFSLSKAAEAFQCIEQYAANLLNQPWRVEYRTIKQYNGFYTHNIKSVLSGADKLFFNMGYTKDSQDPELFVLPLTSAGENCVNLDCVTQVARDCLLAKMEALILQEIYVGVTCQFELSFEELLEYRRDHIGTPEDATRELLFRKSQVRFQFPAGQIYSPFISGAYPAPVYHPTNFGGGGAAPFGALPASVGTPFPPTYAIPSQPGYSPMSYPVPQMNGAPGGNAIYNGLVNGAIPNGLSPTGGIYANGMGPPQVLANGNQQPMSLPVVGSNGAGVAQVAAGQDNKRSNTGRSPAASSSSTIRNGQIPTTVLDIAGDEHHGGGRSRDKSERSNKSRDSDRDKERDRDKDRDRDKGARRRRKKSEGVEEIENWDFVYKELEQQGYSKDQAERPDVLAINNRVANYNNHDRRASGHHDHQLTTQRVSMYEDEDLRRGMRRMHLDDSGTKDRRKSGNYEYHKDRMSDGEAGGGGYMEDPAPPQRTRRGGSTSQAQGGAAHRSKAQPLSEAAVGKWSCESCTYLNSADQKICEICSKSREPKSYRASLVDNMETRQQMQHVRDREVGRNSNECSKCTLVNTPSAKVCEACGASLGRSPPK